MSTAYLAAPGYEAQLRDELSQAAVVPERIHGRLFITSSPPIQTAWALNTWIEVEAIEVISIGDAARQLRQRQRSWWSYVPDDAPAGRTKLICEQLPHVSARPLQPGEATPSTPLGSFTLLGPNLMLAAARCSSSFPNGEIHFVEDRTGPPSRAYLKLWEAFVRLGRWPKSGEGALDLGASPGGWTWALARRGATVLAIDRAPLDRRVAALPNVAYRKGDAFAVDAGEQERFDWVCCDVAAYPNRSLELAKRWIDSGRAKNVVVTIKLQDGGDHNFNMSNLVHMFHNRHELTLLWPKGLD